MGGWLGGGVGGWSGGIGLNENITTSAPIELGLGLGLRLAKLRTPRRQNRMKYDEQNQIKNTSNIRK